MKSMFKLTLVALVLGLALTSSPGLAQTRNNLFFLHNSTGRGFINQGDLRGWLQTYNNQHNTGYVFWDHDYNYVGLRKEDGGFVEWIYNIPDDNTTPVGLHKLWTTANAARDSVLMNHDVIAFKSCYPASAITTPEILAQYKTWYLAIRAVLDQHPDKVFVVMSTPPLHRLATDLTQADNARAFANWLKSPEFLQGHPNLVTFDLFDVLAAPDVAGSATRNMLRYEFELGHSNTDSHPNAAANLVVGPRLGAALVAAAQGNNASAAPTPALTRPALTVQPNPFNPAAVITFDLAAAAPVRLSIFDLRGHLVRTLAEGQREAGSHRIRWDGRDNQGQDAPAGIYLCRLQAGEAAATQRMALIR